MKSKKVLPISAKFLGFIQQCNIELGKAVVFHPNEINSILCRESNAPFILRLVPCKAHFHYSYCQQEGLSPVGGRKRHSTEGAHWPLWSWNMNRHCSAHSPSSGKSGTNEMTVCILPSHSEKGPSRRETEAGQRWQTDSLLDETLAVMKGFKSYFLFSRN